MNDIKGRHLLLHEVSDLLDERKMASCLIEDGVAKRAGAYFCHRCGNDKPYLFAAFHCARCQKLCHYCRNCLMMGRVSECTKLISLPMDETNRPLNVELNWNGTLSKGQEKASLKITEAIEEETPLLIWAVCGAGKTEILFKGIEKALQTGKYVCIATPRSDVVRELAPRLKQAFPKVDVAALYGGSEDRGKLSPLTIATTHQLYRYKEAFDVMIIDEVDAFPYSVDVSLQFAVKKAQKKKSSLIYLTATPSSFIRRQFTPLQIVKIPARYHGYPLPIPKFQWCGNWKKALKKNRLPNPVMKWVDAHVVKEKQAFLFVPDIQTVPLVVNLLKDVHPHIEGVHAEDPHRKEKVQQFREQKVLIMVTTTILERGVTVPGADVAVLGAEQDIFTESALVQISGRVGRSINAPTGSIIFFHFGKTNAMVQAKHHIEEMNALAHKEGLLKQSSQ